MDEGMLAIIVAPFTTFFNFCRSDMANTSLPE